MKKFIRDTFWVLFATVAILWALFWAGYCAVGFYFAGFDGVHEVAVFCWEIHILLFAIGVIMAGPFVLLLGIPALLIYLLIYLFKKHHRKTAVTS